MRRERGVRAALFGAVAISIAALAACQKDRPNASDNSSTGIGAQTGGSACSTPNEGCPCDSPGLQVSCGQVERRSGDYVSCSLGMEACGANGKWGPCVGDGVATSSVYAPPSGLGITALAGSSQVCVNNPCDPSCMNYTDSPGGVDAGPDSGLTTVDAGMSIVGTLVSASNSTCTGLQPMANQTMVVTSLSPITTTPSTSNFTTSIVPSGCYIGSVTPLWGVDRFDLGVISSAGSYSQVVPVPAVVTVTGYAGSFSTSATVTVTVNVTDTTSGPAPSGYTAASFTGSTTSTETAPKILYPYTGTVFPLGLTAPLFMWQRVSTATAAKAVKVSLAYSGFSWAAIVPEGSQRFQIPQSAWTAFGQAAAGNTGTITVQRIDSTNKLQAAVSVSVKFAPANLRGRIYYAQYANSGSTGDIKSVLPYGSVAPVTLYNPAASGGNCGVCHSMSSDGSKFIASSENASSAPGNSAYAISNVRSDGTLQALNVGPTGGGDSRGLAYAAITKTGSYALLGNNWWGNVNGGANATTPGTAGPKFKVYQLPTTVGGAYPDVSDTGSGGTGNVWGLGSAQMYTPVFSPDNTRLLFVDADTSGGAASRQGISYWTFSESTKKFSSRTLAVKTNASGPSGLQNKYVRWPAWENDSRSVIFQTAATTDDDGFDWYAGMLPSGCCGRQKNHGQFWSMDLGVGGGANTPVALANLNTGLGSSSPLGTDDTNRNYQPTELGVAVGGYRWIVFTSIRAYGNFLNTSTGALTNDTNKLWVAAIDDATSGTIDRSHPPFLLPNQDLSSGTLNERGYWALDACKAPDLTASTCSGNDECCGYNAANVSASTALCKVDSPLTSPPTFHCKSTTSASCKALGATCSQNSDCCGFPPSPVCVSGICQALPPVVQYNGPDTFWRDYTATCASGKSVKWRFFDWETSFPSATGASIAFKAATAKTQATLSTATQVALGSQTATNTTWIGADVSTALTAASQTSKAWLRVYMTFNPTTDHSGTPTLTAWRQSYDCVDSE